MSNLPFSLPPCDQRAAIRIEVYSPTALGDSPYGSLDASVYVCEFHGMDVATAIWVENLTPFKTDMAPYGPRYCGESTVFPTGTFGDGR